jgi:hypothetical protein
MVFVGVTPYICQLAFEMCRPAIQVAADMGIINKFAGTLIVLDPNTGDVLFEKVINETHPSAGMYTGIARAKARVTWETSLPSRVVQQEAPHLYQEGMTKWGGAVIEHKLVVAFSGVEAVFDEAISWMILSWIFGICRHEMTKPEGVMAQDFSFIGGNDETSLAALVAQEG